MDETDPTQARQGPGEDSNETHATNMHKKPPPSMVNVRRQWSSNSSSSSLSWAVFRPLLLASGLEGPSMGQMWSMTTGGSALRVAVVLSGSNCTAGAAWCAAAVLHAWLVGWRHGTSSKGRP